MEPWPDQRADFNAALVASVIARCLSESDVTPDAFVPDYWERVRPEPEPVEQTPEQINATLEQLARVFPGAIVEDKRKK